MTHHDLKERLPAIQWSAIFTAFGTVGFFVGWLIGASATPVVSSVLPLLFGVIGALSLQYLERRTQENHFASHLDKLMIDGQTKQLVRDGLKLDDPHPWTTSLWCLGMILFCATCAVGLSYGMDLRRGDRRPLATVLHDNEIDSDKISASDRARLHNLLFRLQSQSQPKEAVDDIFANVVGPALNNPPPYSYPTTVEYQIETLFSDVRSPTAPPVSSEAPMAPAPPPMAPGQ